MINSNLLFIIIGLNGDHIHMYKFSRDINFMNPSFYFFHDFIFTNA